MGSFAAIREHFDAPIGQVYGVTFDLQFARVPRCRGAVIHALHTTCHESDDGPLETRGLFGGSLAGGFDF